MAELRHIQLLSMHVANKIAAGEVVERPASVLKELVENAFDSGASQVDVDIVAGGRKLVSVTDNGSGMTRDDALLSIEQHATSKIRDVDDIEHIGTLGFRGEALAAICSASRFNLKTSAAGQEVGTELLVSGGKIRDVRDIGFPRGTQIEVRDIFFNIPARRKFLRSPATEVAHIRGCFVSAALSHPETGMSLRIDGQDIYRLPAQGKFGERIRDLFGSEMAQHLREISCDHNDVSIRGYAGIPRVSRADRTGQYVFVNGRSTSAPVIGYAIREGYSTLLPRDRHPVVFLEIDVPKDAVDVNVHPTKREVRFRRSNDVRDAVTMALREALRVGPQEASSAAAALRLESAPAPVRPPRQLEIANLPVVRAFSYPGLPRTPELGFDRDTMPGKVTAATSDARDDLAALDSAPWEWCRVVGQVGGLYVLLETEDGFVIMDPHAAHERVLFEKFMKDVLAGRINVQKMLMPETANLQPGDAAYIRRNLELLQQMGFGISEFGHDTFVVDAVPSYFSAGSASILLPEIAQSLSMRGARGVQEHWREDAIAQAACKAAVKAHDRLRVEEIEKLVVDLAVCDMPYTCPHGRPTLLFHSFHELARKFSRE